MNLGLSEDIDGVWPKVKAIFADMTKVNTDIVQAVKGIMEEKTLLSKYQKTKDDKDVNFPPPKDGDENGALLSLMVIAVAGGRAAFDPALKELAEKEITDIRAEVAKPDMKKADQACGKAVPKVKEAVIPKVDHSKAKDGVILLSLPEKYKKDDVSGAPKVPLDTFMKLFDLVSEIGEKRIKEIKERIENQLKEVKEKAGPSKLSEACKEKTKDMGMGDKMKYMKQKGSELAENGKRATVLKDFLMVLINKVKDLGQLFLTAFTNAVKYAMKFEPDIEGFYGGLPAPPETTILFAKSSWSWGQDLTTSDIKKMFEEADKGKSGKLCIKEFLEVLGAEKPSMKESFKLTGDDDKKLDFDEFLAAIWFRPLFKDAAGADDGKPNEDMSSQDLMAFCAQTGKHNLRTAFMLNMNDPNDDRRIDFDGFRDMVYLRPLFDKIDKDKAGSIKITEMMTYMQEQGKDEPKFLKMKEKMEAVFKVNNADKKEEKKEDKSEMVTDEDAKLDFVQFEAMITS